MKGRGSGNNPHNRFAALLKESFDDGWGEGDPGHGENPQTIPLMSDVRSIISYNQSPDVPFDRSVNPYQGCEHGCIYCYARPSHAYLDMSPGLDFETRIVVKRNAAAQLRRELSARSYRCAVMAVGANTDAYQPLERRYGITRQLLEVLQAFRHPLAIVTKSALIERDIDILQQMARDRLAEVFVTVDTLDPALARRLDPRAAAPKRRLQVIETLVNAGIPTGVLVAPVIPALTDADMESIVQTAADLGATMAGYVLLRLPREVEGLFEQWLQQHYPLKAAHVLSLIEQSRDGARYDSTFGARMRGSGLFAQMLRQRFDLATRKLGLNRRDNLGRLRVDLFSVPSEQSLASQAQSQASQLSLF